MRAALLFSVKILPVRYLLDEERVTGLHSESAPILQIADKHFKFQ